MNDFTKNKIAFAIALLAVLFTVSPIILDPGSSLLGFDFLGLHLDLRMLYYALAILLSCSVYCYAVLFMFDNPIAPIIKSGDYFYLTAMMAPILYITLFAIERLTSTIGEFTREQPVANVINVTLALVSIAVATAAVVVNTRLLDKLQRNILRETYFTQESRLFDRAIQLFKDEHFDLSVVECYKAIEVATRRIMLSRPPTKGARWHTSGVDFLLLKELLPEELLPNVVYIRQQRNLAAHRFEPMGRSTAEQILNSTEKILGFLSRLDNSGVSGSDS